MQTIKVLLLGLSMCSLLFFTQRSVGLTTEKWAEDLDYLHKTLEERHLNLYHQISKEEFTQELNLIKQQPDQKPGSTPLALMRLFQKIGDGHTQFAYWGNPHHRFPVEFYMDNGKIYLTGINDNHKHLLGMELIAINKTPTTSIIQQLNPLLQAVENTYSQQQRMIETIGVGEMLYWLEIIKSPTEAKFYFADTRGKSYSIQLKAMNADNSTKLTRIEPKLPTDFIPYNTRLDGVEMFVSSKKRTAIIRLNSYPHRGMSQYAENLSQIFNQHHIDNVIIDLRKNGGGDFFVGLTLAWGIILCDRLNWENGIYVLTGRKTFSAGMSNAAQFRQLLNARLVGEPTGSNPVGYQDADTFVLPNSNWKIMHSKRFYRFQDAATQGVQPDIFLPLDWNQFKNGRDNQLEWVIEDIEKRSGK
jgi:hypothetical protein